MALRGALDLHHPRRVTLVSVVGAFPAIAAAAVAGVGVSLAFAVRR